MARPALPQVIGEVLHGQNGSAQEPIVVGSAAWFVWLANDAHTAFSVATAAGAVTVRCERKGSSAYWYAYHRSGPNVRKGYLGKTDTLTMQRLGEVAETLTQPAGAVPTPVTSNNIDQLQLRLLGMPQCLRGTQPLPLSSAKAIALLGYLAVADAAPSRAHVLAWLWPESSEEAARKNLRNTLWTIRTLLGDNVIVSEGERLELHAGLPCDVRSFVRLAPATHARPAEVANIPTEQLEHALGLYGGTFLDDLTLPNEPEFELWLTTERERLLQRYADTGAELIARQRTSGDWVGVAATAQQVLAHDTLAETAHRALIEALARRGDRAGALRQYERLRVVLERELSASPTPETEAIHAAIVGGRLGNPTPRPALMPPLGPSSPPNRGPFIGRTAELAALTIEMAAAKAGQARVVVVSGELGIGKSRLWQTWAGHVPGGALLEAHCLEATRSMPFAPLIALWSNTTWSARAAAALGATSPSWLQELTRLLPSLQELLPRPVIGSSSPAEERQRLFEAFVQGLLAVTQPPRVLFIDDLHWADQTTLDWLDYCLHRLHDTPLLLVVTYRSEDSTHDLLRRIAQWDRDGRMRRLALKRLSADEATALLVALDASAVDYPRLTHQSAGNPYFLTELARSEPSDVPIALIDLVRARIQALPEPARQVLGAAGVLELDIESATLMLISTLPEDVTLDAIDALLAAGVLIEQDERYVFSHPLVATVVRDTLSRARRVALHRRAATTLTQVYADHLPAQAGRIAAHYRECGDRLQAARYAELAGDYAFSVAAVAETVAFYREAIASEPSPIRRLSLGRALIWHGEQDEARASIMAAYDGFLAQQDSRNAALAMLVLADLALTYGGYAEAGQFAERALGLAGDADPFTAAAAHILIGTSARAAGAIDAAQQHIDASIRLAEQYDLHDIRMYGAVGLSNIRAEQGDLAGALAAARELVHFARLAGNSFYEIVGHNNAAFRATLLGKYADAHTHIEAGLQLADVRGLDMPRQWLYSTRGELALAEGQWDVAESWFVRGRAEALRRNNPGQVAIYDANLGRVAQGRGDLERAIRLLEQAQHGGTHETADYQQIQIGLWLAALYTQGGNPTRARTALQTAVQQFPTNGYVLLRTQAEEVRSQIEQSFAVVNSE